MSRLPFQQGLITSTRNSSIHLARALPHRGHTHTQPTGVGYHQCTQILLQENMLTTIAKYHLNNKYRHLFSVSFQHRVVCSAQHTCKKVVCYTMPAISYITYETKIQLTRTATSHPRPYSNTDGRMAGDHPRNSATLEAHSARHPRAACDGCATVCLCKNASLTLHSLSAATLLPNHTLTPRIQMTAKDRHERVNADPPCRPAPSKSGIKLLCV